MIFWMYVLGGLALAAAGVPMMLRKVPPNWVYGFKVPKTVNNPAVWYPANAYAGKALLIAGLVSAAAAVALRFWPGITLNAYALACLTVMMACLAVTLAACFRYLATL